MHFSRVVALATLLFAAVPALAQPADSKIAAKEHFERGVAAFNDRRFGDAAQEFDAAYRISPAFAVLYNIGQVNVALGNPVEAVEALEKYLAQAGTSIDDARRREVQQELERQNARIGTLTVTAQPQGAEILLDGSRVGLSPLSTPLRLGAGKHSVVVIADGYKTEKRDIDLQPRSALELEMNLDPVLSSQSAVVSTAPREASQSPAPLPIVTTTIIRETASAGTTPKAQSTPDLSTGSAQRGVGYIVGGIGIAVAAAGGVLAIISTAQASSAKSRESQANSSSPPDGAAYDAAKSDYDSAQSLNRLGLQGLGVGAGLVLVGGIIVLTAPSPKVSTTITLTPFKTATSSGISAGLVW